jgi:hypothetical protein
VLWLGHFVQEEKTSCDGVRELTARVFPTLDDTRKTGRGQTLKTCLSLVLASIHPVVTTKFIINERFCPSRFFFTAGSFFLLEIQVLFYDRKPR